MAEPGGPGHRQADGCGGRCERDPPGEQRGAVGGCQAGYSLINLGRLTARDGGRAPGRRYVRRGEALLESGAYGVPKGDPSQRRALYEGAWLATGYNVSGDLERACEIGRTAAARLESVRSPRSVALLEDLAVDLRQKRRNPYVRTFLPELEQRLSTYASTAGVGARATVAP